MSRALRASVPLNSRCSRKCDTPDSSSGSSLAPTPTHTPAATESAVGTRSVTTRSPEGSCVTSVWGWRGPFLTARAIERRRGPQQLSGAGGGGDRRRGGHRRPTGRRPARDRGHRRPRGPRRRTPPRRRRRPGVGRRASRSSHERRAGGPLLALAAVAVGLRDLTVVADRGQADLAAVVDVVDTDLDLVAEVDHVLDPVDPLAPAQLGDVDQAVAAREDVDEGAELGDVDHPAGVDLAHVGRRRIDDEHDPLLGRLDLQAVGGADGDRADRAVVVDGDVGAGLLLDQVDDLALGPDHLTDAVDRDLERRDLRRRLAHLGPRPR